MLNHQFLFAVIFNPSIVTSVFELEGNFIQSAVNSISWERKTLSKPKWVQTAPPIINLIFAEPVSVPFIDNLNFSIGSSTKEIVLHQFYLFLLLSSYMFTSRIYWYCVPLIVKYSFNLTIFLISCSIKFGLDCQTSFVLHSFTSTLKLPVFKTLIIWSKQPHLQKHLHFLLKTFVPVLLI